MYFLRNPAIDYYLIRAATSDEHVAAGLKEDDRKGGWKEGRGREGRKSESNSIDNYIELMLQTNKRAALHVTRSMPIVYRVDTIVICV